MQGYNSILSLHAHLFQTFNTSSQILDNHVRQSIRRSSPNTSNLRSVPERHLSRHGVYLIFSRDILRFVEIHPDELCFSLESFHQASCAR
jgi:hypothetical protein